MELKHLSDSSKSNKQSSLSHNQQYDLLNNQSSFSNQSVHSPQKHFFKKRKSITSLVNHKISVPKTPNDYVNSAYNDENDDFSDQTEMIENSGYNNTISSIDDIDALHKSSANHCNTNMNVSIHKPEIDQQTINEENPLETTTNTTYSTESFHREKTAPEPDDDETAESKWVSLSIQWLKVAIIIGIFLANLIFAVISKSTILLMTSMVASDHNVTVCNTETSFLVTEPLEHDKLYKVQYSDSGGFGSRIAWLWCLTFALISPYVFSFVRALRIVYFKTAEKCSFATFVIVFTFETLHSIGLSLFAFFLLPQMDVIKGAMMMNSVAALPVFLRLFVVAGESLEVKENLAKPESASRKLFWKLTTNKIVSASAFLAQMLSIVAWTTVGYTERQTTTHWYLLPVALILSSFEWWQNYLVPKRKHIFLSVLENAQSNLEDKNRSRYFVALITMPWKALITVAMMVLSQAVVPGTENSFEVSSLFSNFTSSIQNSPTVPVSRIKGDGGVLLDTEHHLLYVNFALWPVVILLGHITFTYLCYAFAKFTCKVGIHEISFAIPITITVPVTVSLLWALKSLAIEDKCQLTAFFEPFQYIFWRMGDMGTLGASFQYTSEAEGGYGLLNIFLVFGLWLCLGLTSQAAATLHIWTETNERLAPTEHIFLNPGYNALLIDQSLAMNRRTTKVAIFDPEKVTKETKAEEAARIREEKNAQLEEERERKRILEEEKAQIAKKAAEENHLRERTTKETKVKTLKNSSLILKAQQSKPLLTSKSTTKKVPSSPEYNGGIDPKKTDSLSADETVRIYACTTMWHETSSEMLQTLKSIFRLDKDQEKLEKAKAKGKSPSSYYQLEANVFFDDAFEKGSSKNNRVVNKYVHQLIEALPEAACHVHWQSGKAELVSKTPTLVATPYGGRLVWRLPGGSLLVVHLKDKTRIRHRKRWSQCMYLYYLLDYRLSSRDDLLDDDPKKSDSRKKTISNNTFILALDGDINFRPEAVHMVVDLMKRNGKLGAVCGRIHPVGSGPIVWYQKFEYAIGHWLQKATEHVFGCVLCSPGCFSLFRARALMDDSVMHKYTTKPSEAIHYVQYDQGEDRWLCTLMLQRGWRIEYCAASDSYTHAPEGFAEIFIQRRRWAPSTMANILDLLSNYKRTVERNENISLLYIAYQGFLMVGTLLSPGTIFLMVVSAMNSALNLDARLSLLFNVVAVVTFTAVCLKSANNDLKINLAMLLSLVYALLMLAVLAGIVIDAYKEGSIFSPNSLFFSAMMGSFLLAAVLHPREFACVLPLPLYMLLIPSMYMLLTIYSVTNMNIVAWGTRENEEKEDEEEEEKEEEDETSEKIGKTANEKSKTKKADEKKNETDGKKEKKSLFQKYLDASNTAKTAKSGFITCVCCCSGRVAGERDFMAENFQHINRRVEENEVAKNVVEIKILVEKLAAGQSLVVNQEKTKEITEKKTEQVEKKNSSEKKKIIYKWDVKSENKFSYTEKELHPREKVFWNCTLAKYLYPMDKNPKEEERISLALIDLRNRAVFAFSFLNAIFILFVFILQLHKDVFGVDIPIGIAGYNRTFIEEENVWHVETVWLKTRMDPITLCLVVFFGAILVIQLIGMLIHRFGTLAQLLAYTKLSFCQKADDDGHTQKIHSENVSQQNNINQQTEIKKQENSFTFATEKTKNSFIFETKERDNSFNYETQC